MQILVRDNNVDQALRALKKKLQREGVYREMKLRRHYEKPSEKRAREKAAAVRRARKMERKRLEREGSVERRTDPRNRRRDHWFLLPAGEARLASAREAGGPVMTQMLSLLSGAEVEAFKGYLERCVEGLEQTSLDDAAARRPRARVASVRGTSGRAKAVRKKTRAS